MITRFKKTSQSCCSLLFLLHDIKIAKTSCSCYNALLRDLETCNGISCLCCVVLFSDLKTLLFCLRMFYYTIIINILLNNFFSIIDLMVLLKYIYMLTQITLNQFTDMAD